jgi:hypothetical protein
MSIGLEDVNPVARADELILTQYKNSPNLINYIKCFLAPMQEQATSMSESYFSLQINYATGHALDKIARIVGESRIIRGAAALGYFGFKEEPSAFPLDEGIFFSYGEAESGDLVLSDPALRNIIRARIIKNTSGGKIEDILEYLQLLIGREVDIEITEETAHIDVTVKEVLGPQDKTLVAFKVYEIVPTGVSVTLKDDNGIIDLEVPSGYPET